MRTNRTTFAALGGLGGVLVCSLLVLAQPADRPRGFLGVVIDPEQADTKVVVRDVNPNSPAATAGLKMGDVIVKVNDKDVKTGEAFMQALANAKAGDQVKLQVMRQGKEERMTVTLGERPGAPGRAPQFREFAPRGGAHLGIGMQELTAELRERLKVEASKGVLVTEVEPNSAAAKAGLKAEDVILGIGDKSVAGPEELRTLIRDTGAGKEVTIRVQRGQEKLDLKATLGQGEPRAFQPPDFPRGNFEPPTRFWQGDPKVGELEKKVQRLEKRIQELEKKLEKK